jgi:hypothetical protein
MKHEPRARPPPTTRNIPELGISTGIPLTEYRLDVPNTRIPSAATDSSSTWMPSWRDWSWGDGIFGGSGLQPQSIAWSTPSRASAYLCAKPTLIVKRFSLRMITAARDRPPLRAMESLAGLQPPAGRESTGLRHLLIRLISRWYRHRRDGSLPS